MRAFIEKRLLGIAPLFIRPAGDLPPPDAGEIVAFLDEYLGKGLPEFRALYYLMAFSLYGICLLRKGRPLAKLQEEEAVDFIESLYSSRFAALRAVPLLLGLPLYMAHYSRDDIQPLLGFPAQELREEAAKREVRR